LKKERKKGRSPDNQKYNSTSGTSKKGKNEAPRGKMEEVNEELSCNELISPSVEEGEKKASERT